MSIRKIIPYAGYDLRLIPSPGDVARTERLNARRLELWAQIGAPVQPTVTKKQRRNDSDVVTTYTANGRVQIKHRAGQTLDEYA